MTHYDLIEVEFPAQPIGVDRLPGWVQALREYADACDDMAAYTVTYERVQTRQRDNGFFWVRRPDGPHAGEIWAQVVRDEDGDVIGVTNLGAFGTRLSMYERAAEIQATLRARAANARAMADRNAAVVA